MNSSRPSFHFIDLFAGIGGLRIPFDELGGDCVFTSELDRHARATYLANFASENHHMNNDIRLLEDLGYSSVPDHSLLLAGFPCQPFSHAGKRRGIDDTRGTLFFDIAEIISAKKPRVVLLENVRGLRTIDGGKTFARIIEVIRGFGYEVHSSLLNARDFGLPQNRIRLFIVAIRNDIPLAGHYKFPPATHDREKLMLGEILDKDVDPSLVISDRLWNGHKARRARSRAEGKGFGYQLFDSASPYAATMSARYYKDGSEILIARDGGNPRKLSVSEARRLQGFPDWFQPSISRVQAYKQFGNAVPVSVVRALAASLESYL